MYLPWVGLSSNLRVIIGFFLFWIKQKVYSHLRGRTQINWAFVQINITEILAQNSISVSSDVLIHSQLPTARKWWLTLWHHPWVKNSVIDQIIVTYLSHISTRNSESVNSDLLIHSQLPTSRKWWLTLRHHHHSCWWVEGRNSLAKFVKIDPLIREKILRRRRGLK